VIDLQAFNHHFRLYGTGPTKARASGDHHSLRATVSEFMGVDTDKSHQGTDWFGHRAAETVLR
jgi:ribonuclease D